MVPLVGANAGHLTYVEGSGSQSHACDCWKLPCVERETVKTLTAAPMHDKRAASGHAVQRGGYILTRKL